MRIIETDFEWNKFLKELSERKTKKLEEVDKLLEPLDVSLEGEAIDENNENYRTFLRKIEKPDFLNDIPEEDWDVENVFKLIRQRFYAQGIELKNETQERKYYVVEFQLLMQEKKVAKATVVKIFSNLSYADLYRNNSTALVSFFHYLATSEPNLAYKVLNMYERTLPFRVLKAVKMTDIQIDIYFEMRALRKTFIDMVNGANMSKGDLREVISLIGKSTKRFSSGTWYKNLYFNSTDFAELIKETYSLLYNYGELDNVQNALLSSKI